MEIHRHELKYSLVLIDASAEHGGITHVRGKMCEAGQVNGSLWGSVNFLKLLPWSEAFLDREAALFLAVPCGLKSLARLPRKYRDQGDEAWIRFR
jgi:hypothetical protein